MSIQQRGEIGGRSLAKRQHGPGWLLAKGGFTFLSAGIVVGAFIVSGVTVSRPFVTALLVRTVVYFFGVWRPQRILIFGTLLILLTGGPWFLYLMDKRESMAGVDIVMGSVWSFMSSIVGAVLELTDRNWRRRQIGPPLVPPLGSSEAVLIEERPRPRAW